MWKSNDGVTLTELKGPAPLRVALYAVFYPDSFVAPQGYLPNLDDPLPPHEAAHLAPAPPHRPTHPQPHAHPSARGEPSGNGSEVKCPTLCL